MAFYLGQRAADDQQATAGHGGDAQEVAAIEGEGHLATPLLAAR